MIATPTYPSLCSNCGQSIHSSGTGTAGSHVCVVERETCPDLSRLSRADRRAVEAIAKRYGWKMPKK